MNILMSFLSLLDQDVFEPDVRVSHGRPTIFIPTKAVIATVQVLHFFLENHISMMLIGSRGCGKSLSFSKVVPHLSPGWTVKYLLLGGKRSYFDIKHSRLSKIWMKSQSLMMDEKILLGGPENRFMEILANLTSQRAGSNLNQRWKIRATTITITKFKPKRS